MLLSGPNGNNPCLLGFNPICCPPTAISKFAGVHTLLYVLVLCIPICITDQTNPFGDSINCPILATSTNALSVDVTTPPLIKSTPIILSILKPNPHFCGSFLFFLCIPLKIKGCLKNKGYGLKESSCKLNCPYTFVKYDGEFSLINKSPILT